MDKTDIPNSLYINGVIFGLFICTVVPKMILNIKLDVVCFSSILMLLCVVSFMINGITPLLFNNTIVWLFGCGLVSYIVVRYVDDWDYFLNVFANSSVIVLLCIIGFWMFSRNIIRYKATPEWYMFFSTAIVIPVIGVFILYNKKIKMVYLIIFLIGIFLNFVYGSRGSLVQVVVFFLLYHVLQKKYFEGIMRIAFLVFITLCFLRYIFLHIDISYSRTLSFLFNNSIKETDRITAWKKMLNYLMEQPMIKKMFGLGLAGDRVFIYNSVYRAGYPHNILVELILQYGYIGFTIILVILSMLFLKTMKKIYGGGVLASVFSLFFVHFIILFISSSYLISNNLFFLLAFCIDILQSRQYDNA